MRIAGAITWLIGVISTLQVGTSELLCSSHISSLRAKTGGQALTKQTRMCPRFSTRQLRALDVC